MSNKNDIGDHKCSAGDFGIVISKGERVSSDLTDKEKIGDLQMRVAELERLTKQNENEKFLLNEILKMKKEKITEPSVIDKKGGIKWSKK